MTDAAARELIAGFLRTLESLEGANANVRTLVDAHEAGRRPSDQAILEYRADCRNLDRSVATLRAMLMTLLETDLRMH